MSEQQTNWEKLSPSEQEKFLKGLDEHTGTRFVLGMKALEGDHEACEILKSRTQLLVKEKRLKPAGKK